MSSADLPIYPSQMPRILSANGVSIPEDVLYTDGKGRARRKRQEARRRNPRGSPGVLPGLLQPKETVLFVIKSCQAPIGVLEQLFLGWYVYRVTATRLVLTNLLLLHFGLSGRGKWNRTLKSLRWGDVAEAKVKGWLSRILVIQNGNGKKEKYWRLKRRDSQKAKAILSAEKPQGCRGFQSVCPDCRAPLAEGNYQCAACGLKFKDEKKLLQRTMLIPGGGYFYAGFTFLGVKAFITEGAFTPVLKY